MKTLLVGMMMMVFGFTGVGMFIGYRLCEHDYQRTQRPTIGQWVDDLHYDAPESLPTTSDRKADALRHPEPVADINGGDKVLGPWEANGGIPKAETVDQSKSDDPDWLRKLREKLDKLNEQQKEVDKIIPKAQPKIEVLEFVRPMVTYPMPYTQGIVIEPKYPSTCYTTLHVHSPKPPPMDRVTDFE